MCLDGVCLVEDSEIDDALPGDDEFPFDDRLPGGDENPLDDRLPGGDGADDGLDDGEFGGFGDADLVCTCLSGDELLMRSFPNDADIEALGLVI